MYDVLFSHQIEAGDICHGGKRPQKYRSRGFQIVKDGEVIEPPKVDAEMAEVAEAEVAEATETEVAEAVVVEAGAAGAKVPKAREMDKDTAVETAVEMAMNRTRALMERGMEGNW
jgi:hypothetical protein